MTNLPSPSLQACPTLRSVPRKKGEAGTAEVSEAKTSTIKSKKRGQKSDLKDIFQTYIRFSCVKHE